MDVTAAVVPWVVMTRVKSPKSKDLECPYDVDFTSWGYYNVNRLISQNSLKGW